MKIILLILAAGGIALSISHSHTAETYGYAGFLDLYRATGDKRMLQAMRGAWEMMRKDWQHAGTEDAIPNHGRYAIEYGPILLAAKGPLGKPIPVLIRQDPAGFASRLVPIPDKPLHFAVPGQPDHVFVPYWQLGGDDTFTCYPVIEAGANGSR